MSDDHDSAPNQPSLGGDPHTVAAANPQGHPSADPYAPPSAAQYAPPPADPYGQHAYGQQSGQYLQSGYGAPAAYGAGQLNPAWTQGPTEAGASTVTLNYWLSVFFSWIPALIFYLSEKDKNALVADHVKENMNFQLTRVIAGLVATIPVVGWIVGGIASLVLFVFAVMGAVQGPQAYRSGRAYRFPFSLRIIN
nr:DUF4870 domain-containing protein [Tessaracoccus sp. OS52]